MKLPNVGPKVADMLLRIGVHELADIRATSADALYDRLNTLDGRRHDPCLLDTFMALEAFAAGEPPRPWWEYTPLRKEREKARQSA